MTLGLSGAVKQIVIFFTAMSTVFALLISHSESTLNQLFTQCSSETFLDSVDSSFNPLGISAALVPQTFPVINQSSPTLLISPAFFSANKSGLAFGVEETHLQFFSPSLAPDHGLLA